MHYQQFLSPNPSKLWNEIRLEIGYEFEHFVNLLCCPEFSPHISGITWPVLTVVVSISWHKPPLVSAVSAGPFVVNRSKSKRRSHTAKILEIFQKRYQKLTWFLYMSRIFEWWIGNWKLKCMLMDNQDFWYKNNFARQLKSMLRSWKRNKRQT